MHRSTYYYQPVGESPYNLGLVRRIDELFMDLPFFGSRQMRNTLRDEGHRVGRERVRRLMRKMGLMAIMDWHSRAVLAWRLSNTMDTDFCLSALEDALNRYGVPEIFNRQGSQFTSYEFTRALREVGTRISMDGRGRWLDNVMIERLWRSLKYECVYLREMKTGSEFREALVWWFDFYNNWRPHFVFDGMKPMDIYQGLKPEGVSPLVWPYRAA